jgi:large subunit ribosomal protein L13
MDCGDNVIVINADKVQLTGKKRTDKVHYWHTGYPGGIKSRTAGQILESAHPERLVEKAVKRMLPGNRLRACRCPTCASTPAPSTSTRRRTPKFST